MKLSTKAENIYKQINREKTKLGDYRSRCIALGERTGLYKDEVVAKNCTPSYLPEFISVQVAKLKK